MRTPTRTLAHRVGAVVATLCAGVAVAAAPVAKPDKSPQGESWASIAKLPDWSGTWAITVHDHEFASVETRENDGGLVPFTPKYLALRANMRLQTEPENLAQCLPAGVPGVMLHRIAMEWLFTPGRVTMITENGEIRRIHTDGREHQSLELLEDSFEGDSIGHWEGQTLVVDTIGFPKGDLLKNGSMRPTINTHYVERFHQIDKDHIQIDSELSDPEIYTRPYKATRTLERIDYDLPEPQCRQTSRGSGDDANLTPPKD